MRKETLQAYVQHALTYLSSPEGHLRWQQNSDRGYSKRQNLTAAVINSCRIKRYENITEVVNSLANSTAGVDGR